MHILLETPNLLTIQGYTDAQIKINFEVYSANFIVNHKEIITEWALDSIDRLDEITLEPLLTQEPEIILIGHQSRQYPPASVIAALGQQRIGFECMSIGAACRTFNILLSEHRRVSVGFLFPG